MILTVLKSGILKKILGFCGAAGFLMCFQACYGTPQNLYDIKGNINDEETGEGIPGLQLDIQTDRENFSVITNENGSYNTSVITDQNTYYLQIKDIDGEENGLYANLDTTLKISDSPASISIRQQD